MLKGEEGSRSDQGASTRASGARAPRDGANARAARLGGIVKPADALWEAVLPQAFAADASRSERAGGDGARREGPQQNPGPRDAESEYHLLIEHSQDLIFIVDTAGVITFASPSWTRRLGHDHDAIVGHRMHDLVHPADSLAWDVCLERALESGEVQSDTEYRMLDSAGEIHWYLANVAPVWDQGRRIVACVGNASDLTERRCAEEETRRLEAQLQQSAKMEAVGRLAGGIAHEFNNLLTGITCNTSLALGELDAGHPAASVLEEIRLAVAGATDLVRQLMVFSSKQVAEPKLVRVCEQIDKLQRMLVRVIGEDILMGVHHDEPQAPIRVDPGQLEQVLVSLVLNAREAMPSGGHLKLETGNVTVDAARRRSHPGLTHGNCVMLRVSDTGHGISLEAQRHLFEPFFTTKPRGRRTGFGLATVYGMVQKAGGAIEVESLEAKGTTLTILFPQASEPDTASLLRCETSSFLGRRETILLVEDETLLRNVASRVLRGLGYHILQAANGPEALRIATDYPGPIDLMFTDVVMPGMNGRELAQRLSALHPETGVLYTSGYTDSILSNEAAHGPLHYLCKPYTPDVLAERIRQVLAEDGFRQDPKACSGS